MIVVFISLTKSSLMPAVMNLDPALSSVCVCSCVHKYVRISKNENEWLFYAFSSDMLISSINYWSSTSFSSPLYHQRDRSRMVCRLSWNIFIDMSLRQISQTRGAGHLTVTRARNSVRCFLTKMRSLTVSNGPCMVAPCVELQKERPFVLSITRRTSEQMMSACRATSSVLR